MALSDPVAAQYEKWIYPQPIMDMEAFCADGATDGVAPHLLHPLYWPDGYYEKRQGRIHILVAGCGANAAARYAYKHPEAQVTGIDLSQASLDHEHYLKEKHKLQNLTLHQMRIEDVGSLGQTFDFIDSVGVLHHLPDPVTGLQQLKSVLSPEGVIAIMLYGFYGRFPIYLLQDFFSRLHLEQTEGDLAIVKQTLAQLSPAQRNQLKSFDMSYDAGLVDLFLHRIDRGYTVPACLEYVQDCDLVFQGWINNHYYYPEGQMQPESALYKMTSLLPEPERWQALELFNGQISQHAFYVCRKDRPESSYRIDFDSPRFQSFIPVRRLSVINHPDPSRGIPASIERHPFPPYVLNEFQIRLFNEIDGRTPVSECIRKSGLQGNPEQVDGYAREFLQTLWRLGYVMFKLPPA